MITDQEKTYCDKIRIKFQTLADTLLHALTLTKNEDYSNNIDSSLDQIKALLNMSDEELMNSDEDVVKLFTKTGQLAQKINEAFYLVSRMDKVREICAIGHAIRHEAGIRIRQPLKEIKIVLRSQDAL